MTIKTYQILPCPVCDGPAHDTYADTNPDTAAQRIACRDKDCALFGHWFTRAAWSALPRRVKDAEQRVEALVDASVADYSTRTEKTLGDIRDARAAVLAAMVVVPGEIERLRTALARAVELAGDRIGGINAAGISALVERATGETEEHVRVGHAVEPAPPDAGYVRAMCACTKFVISSGDKSLAFGDGSVHAREACSLPPPVTAAYLNVPSMIAAALAPPVEPPATPGDPWEAAVKLLISNGFSIDVVMEAAAKNITHWKAHPHDTVAPVTDTDVEPPADADSLIEAFEVAVSGWVNGFQGAHYERHGNRIDARAALRARIQPAPVTAEALWPHLVAECGLDDRDPCAYLDKCTIEDLAAALKKLMK